MFFLTSKLFFIHFCMQSQNFIVSTFGSLAKKPKSIWNTISKLWTSMIVWCFTQLTLWPCISMGLKVSFFKFSCALTFQKSTLSHLHIFFSFKGQQIVLTENRFKTITLTRFILGTYFCNQLQFLFRTNLK
jgi:hypothetical protein